MEKYQDLDEYLNDQYGLNLTLSGLRDLVNEVNKIKNEHEFCSACLGTGTDHSFSNNKCIGCNGSGIE